MREAILAKSDKDKSFRLEELLDTYKHITYEDRNENYLLHFFDQFLKDQNHHFSELFC